MFCCKDMKKGHCCGIFLKMLGVSAFTLFVITIWPAAMDWVHSVNTWIFLVVAVVLMGISKVIFFKGMKNIKKKK
jgi:drug/metabolite transporter (DMT)-like permease